MTAVTIDAVRTGDVFEHDVAAALGAGRRLRRWIAKHLKTLLYAIGALALVFLSVYYMWFLFQILVALATLSPFAFWTVFGVNAASVTLFSIIVYRVSLAEIPEEV